MQRSGRVPVLLRAVHGGLAFAQRQVRRLDHLLGEIPVALHDPALERLATDHYYAHASQYATPEHQHHGLYPFEARAIDRFFPEAPAHLLVHAAGTGREVLALLDMGYTMDAFEPVAAMVETAREAIGTDAQARLACMTVQQWAEKPSGAYAAVLGGWGLWQHVLDQRSRLEVLRAFRQVCPDGPVLLSFWSEERKDSEAPPARTPLYPEPTSRLEKLTRKTLRQHVLGRPPVERGTGWYAGVYVHYVTEEELREEAALAGYDVAYFAHDADEEPHAVLVPAAV